MAVKAVKTAKNTYTVEARISAVVQLEIEADSFMNAVDEAQNLVFEDFVTVDGESKVSVLGDDEVEVVSLQQKY